MRKLIAVLILVSPPGLLWAEVTDTELAAVAKFLSADYTSARTPANQLPTAGSFFVAETGEKDVVTDADAKNATQYYAASLPVGEYRQLWIVSEVPTFGVVARKAFLGPNGVVNWNDDLQGLIRFSLRAELGQRGADRLMELPEDVVRSIFSRARRGVLTFNAQVPELEKKRHVESMDVLFRVALMRDQEEGGTSEQSTKRQ